MMLKVLSSAYTVGRTFFADKKLENFFEVKQKNLPLVVEGKKEEIDLNKLYLSFLT